MIKLPAIALRGMTILPGMIAHFDISREKSLKAVEVSMNENQQIYLVTQKDVESDNPGLDELYQVGIIAEIKQVIKMQNNIVRVLAEGKCRAGIFSFTEKKEYLEAEIEILDDVQEELTQEEKIAMRRSVRESFNQYAKVHGKIAPEGTVIATIPVGYADGLDRHLSRGKGSFSINGHRAPTIGNICMDMTMLDVTGLDVKVGDTVTIFGEDPTITELAEILGTIPYEVLTSVPRRIERIIVK
jgi:hypothetical protein